MNMLKNSVVANDVYGTVSESGVFGRLRNGSPDYTIRILKHLSICLIKPFAGRRPEVQGALKRVLGLYLPEEESCFIAGMRSVLRPSVDEIFAVTEGEANGVLFDRLSYSLQNIAGVFEMSDAFGVLRAEGSDLNAALRFMSAEAEPLPDDKNKIRILNAENYRLMIVRYGAERCDLFIPRSGAEDFYRKLVKICLPSGVRLL